MISSSLVRSNDAQGRRWSIAALPLREKLGAIAKIKAGALTNGMNVREVYRPQWSGLTKTETVWAGLHVLKAHNVIRILEQGTGGQMTEIIELNPGLKRSIAT